jgi:hypothetical protein
VQAEERVRGRSALPALALEPLLVGEHMQRRRLWVEMPVVAAQVELLGIHGVGVEPAPPIDDGTDRGEQLGLGADVRAGGVG